MTRLTQGLAQSVQARLVRHAKDIGADANLVMTRYGIERFLYRLSRSQHADRFVLKGALLLLVWLGEALRPTRDADLLGFGDLSDGALAQIVREVCATEVEPDAVEFLPDTVGVEAIREQDAYGGRRVRFEGRLGTARLAIQVDVGIGDAITPAAELLDYPTLLDMPIPRLRAYPRETVLAEKLHAIFVLGMRNSRMKDYFDVQALLREGKFDPALLGHAIAATFARRRTPLSAEQPVGLSDAFASDPAKQAQWAAFLRNNRLAAIPLGDVLSDVRRQMEAPLAQARIEMAQEELL